MTSLMGTLFEPVSAALFLKMYHIYYNNSNQETLHAETELLISNI